MEEMTELCRAEDRRPKDRTSDPIVTGAFCARRVVSIMFKRYPHLSKRALWKAVQVCSDSIASGPGPQTTA